MFKTFQKLIKTHFLLPFLKTNITNLLQKTLQKHFKSRLSKLKVHKNQHLLFFAILGCFLELLFRFFRSAFAQIVSLRLKSIKLHTHAKIKNNAFFLKATKKHFLKNLQALELQKENQTTLNFQTAKLNTF